MTQRFKMVIEYDGTPFCGWQSQENGTAVQDVLQKALHEFCGEMPKVFGAGRTDTGVHAKGQVAHIILEKETTPETICKAVNFHLKPYPIAVHYVTEVNEEFDARFSASKRHYLYKIIANTTRPVLEKNRVWWVPRNLDAELMQKAANILIGKHDFTTFRSSRCQSNSPIKTLDKLFINQTGKIIEIHAMATSFLHHQIRSFVGCLKQVGSGAWALEDLRHALESCERSNCAALAPPHGLYFMKVDYPEGYEK